MSKWVVRKFRELDELDNFVNGAIQGADVSYFASSINADTIGTKAAPVLAGANLTFKNPAGAVTFAAGVDPGGRLSFSEIKAQVEAAVAGLTCKTFEGQIVFVETTPSTGTVLASSSFGGPAKEIGTVDLRTLSYGGGGSLDGQTIVFKHNGGANLSTTFAAPGNQGAVVTQLNVALVPGGLTASIDGNNHLVVTSSDQGAGASITINAGGTATPTLGLTAGTVTGAATNTANQLLGFDTGFDTAGKVYSTPFGAAPTAPYIGFGYSSNDNVHVCWAWE